MILENYNLSFTKGMTLLFDDNGDKIKVWWSSYTGIQEIYFNNQLVSKVRSFKFINNQCFSSSKNDFFEIKYESNFAYKNSKIKVQLLKNNIIENKLMINYTSDKKRGVYSLLSLIIISAFLATIVNILGIENHGLFYVMILLSIVFAFVFNRIKLTLTEIL